MSLPDSDSDAQIFDRMAKLFEQQRKPYQRTGDGITFNDPLWTNIFQGNWRTLVIFDRGRAWIDGGFGSRTLHYQIESLHGFVFCMFGSVMFAGFGLLVEGVAGLRFGLAAFLWLYGMNLALAAVRVPLLFGKVKRPDARV